MARDGSNIMKPQGLTTVGTFLDYLKSLREPCPKCGGTGWYTKPMETHGLGIHEEPQIIHVGVPCDEDHSKYGKATPESVQKKWIKIAGQLDEMMTNMKLTQGNQRKLRTLTDHLRGK